MNRLSSIVKSGVALRTRDSLRAARRDFIFRRAMHRYLKSPSACSHRGHPIIADLIYGWGNEAWSAGDEYVAACINHAHTSKGPILECGSGLTTILVGAIATQRGLQYWALEHSLEWSAKVLRCLNRYKIDAVALCTDPLKDYGGFCWYRPPFNSMPTAFSLVVCDGPPGDTKGGRYGLVPVMAHRFGVDCVILLDDAGREHERSIANKWAAELNASLEFLGADKPFARIAVA